MNDSVVIRVTRDDAEKLKAYGRSYSKAVNNLIERAKTQKSVDYDLLVEKFKEVVNG